MMVTSPSNTSTTTSATTAPSGGGIMAMRLTTTSLQPPLVAYDQDAALLAPFHYINTVPEKHFSGALIDCFQPWLQVRSEEVTETIKELVADLHSASLLIDDIEDDSQMRRGMPAAHTKFGIPAVINCANYVYFIALAKCHGLQNPDAVQVFVRELLNLHRGQGYDMVWRDAMKCPDDAEYLQMVQDKTGGLFRLVVGLLQAFASENRETDYTPLLNSLAEYFQIRDDLMNLTDKEYMETKSFCEDITEGKFSFPVIHCIHHDRSDTRLVSILEQRTTDMELKRYAVSIMEAAGSFVYTKSKCKELKKKILAEIDGLGGNPHLVKFIEAFDKQLDGLAANQ